MGAQVARALRAGGAVGLVPQRPPAGPGVDAGPLPPGYDLHRVARSHASVGFAPAGHDPATATFHRVLTAGSAPVAVAVRQCGDRLALTLPASAGVGPAGLAALVRQARRVVAADDDLTGLVAAARAAATALPRVAAGVEAGAGRLLRAPTVWEDLVGVLLSTGWSWASARAAVGRLVARLGLVGADGEQAFPTPGAVAAAGPDRLAAEVGAGHRAGPLAALAREVASGRLDPEAWLAPGAAGTGARAAGAGPGGPGGGGAGAGLDDGEVRRAVTALPGFGPWSADVVLGLLGRPRGLALDAWARAEVARLLGRPAVTAAEVARRYAPLGRWAGTGAWVELTADWYPGLPVAAP